MSFARRTCWTSCDARERRTEPRRFEGLPTLEQLEKRHIRHVLEVTKGNRTRAAEVLGIDRRTLYRKASRYGFPLGGEEEDEP